VSASAFAMLASTDAFQHRCLQGLIGDGSGDTLRTVRVGDRRFLGDGGERLRLLGLGAVGGRARLC
jgi:hypothetical protein